MINLINLMDKKYPTCNGVLLVDDDSILENQKQTNDVFNVRNCWSAKL
jgi:hypothetical protein